MSDSRWVVDADLGAVNAKTKKTKAEVDEVGKSFSKWGNEIGNTVLRLGSLVRVIGAIGKEIDDHQQRSADANRSSGSGALARGRAIRSLGLDSGPGGTGGADSSIRNLHGGATLDEREAFLLQLSQASRSSGSPFAPQEIQRAISLQAGGLFTGDELVGSLTKNGNVDGLLQEQGSRRSRLSPAESDELRARDVERQNALRIEAALAPSGATRRIADSFVNARNAESPVAAGLQNVVGGILSPIGGDDFIKSGDRALFIDMNRSLVDIAESNRKLSAGRPSIGNTPDGGPP